MREIKFRAWSITNKCYVGWEDLRKGQNLYYIPWNNNSFNLEQYTGLKDKNGVEIYEGDILEIRFNNGKKSMIIDVEWIERLTGFSGKKREFDSVCNYTALNYSGSVIDGVYIIGNINEENK